MKKLFAIETLAALVLLLVLGSVGWMSQTAAAGDGPQTVTSTFRVEGMTCGGCELGVKMKVRRVDGVESVEASYEDGRAEVIYDPEAATPDDIIAAIEALGYKAELVEDEAES